MEDSIKGEFSGNLAKTYLALSKNRRFLRLLHCKFFR